MAQIEALIDTLKRQLKAHGKTYADVAQALGLAQASVKRLFSERSFSLQRLEIVCQMMGLEISDLVLAMGEHGRRLSQLSEAQEREIAADLLLLLIAISVLNRWSLTDILNHYDIPEHACIQRLAQLDRLKIIELLPGNRIKLLVAPNFRWREDGPIHHFFREKVEQEFFNTRFKADTEKLIVVNGMLSASTNAMFQRKMERLAQEFDELNNDDAALPIDQRFGNTVVLAIRQWRYGLFQRYER